jgi:hypothetical protein
MFRTGFWVKLHYCAVLGEGKYKKEKCIQRRDAEYTEKRFEEFEEGSYSQPT